MKLARAGKPACLLAASFTFAGLATAAVVEPALKTESLAALSTAAEDAVHQYYSAPGSRVVVLAAGLNPGLSLPACQRRLLATVPKRAAPASRISVPVKCAGDGGWLVRVPVSLQLFRSVLVTSHALHRGDGVRLTDVHGEQRDITQLGYGAIEDVAQANGRTLARPLGPGHVLTPHDLGGRKMVLAGDRVRVVVQLDGIEVSTDGLALGGGDNGARLRVRNQSSGRIIDAMVVGPGQVSALP